MANDNYDNTTTIAQIDATFNDLYGDYQDCKGEVWSALMKLTRWGDSQVGRSTFETVQRKYEATDPDEPKRRRPRSRRAASGQPAPHVRRLRRRAGGLRALLSPRRGASPRSCLGEGGAPNAAPGRPPAGGSGESGVGLAAATSARGGGPCGERRRAAAGRRRCRPPPARLCCHLLSVSWPGAM